MWNIVVLMNIYIPDWWRKAFSMHFFAKFLYGRRVCCGLIHKEMYLECWLDESLVDVIVPAGAG
ncbi:hypothetical protein [Escherichia coli]|uniref:hypothetical protein n=1 Tax=Escherichia coli TaxID=562 RepID=UPI003D8D8460